MPADQLILVTGAAGRTGGVGRSVVAGLRARGLAVRALVHREDERAAALRATGAEVVTGDLTHPADVARAVDGCRRVFFTMSVVPEYLEAAVTMAAVAREYGDLEVCVALSQMTVSTMTVLSTTESHQQRLHWLAEQAFAWSSVPVTQLRATVFLEHPFFTTLAEASIARDGTIRLPFGSARTSPVAAADVAEVATTILADPSGHTGKVYELTGPRSQNMTAIAAEYAQALGRPVTYADVPLREWTEHDLAALGLPDHLTEHVACMARLVAQNRYDRLTHQVEELTGHPATSVRAFVSARRRQAPPEP
ncbi:NmrA family NAD(P)-binding protein [Sphaerisporangium corydalis]|uniref:NAD(P)H-binding protein n=1 Tax=Sphaerisporangium corydalis TaxID=1441875 RepID=A0ABV9ECG9_9ACTN|nr:NAD(P)H-binding protein [Sphaerisporangium corydalis]